MTAVTDITTILDAGSFSDGALGEPGSRLRDILLAMAAIIDAYEIRIAALETP